jgi:hypothetical protein
MRWEMAKAKRHETQAAPSVTVIFVRYNLMILAS